MSKWRVPSAEENIQIYPKSPVVICLRTLCCCLGRWISRSESRSLNWYEIIVNDNRRHSQLGAVVRKEQSCPLFALVAS